EFVRATGRAAPLHWIGGNLPEGQERFPVTFVSYDDADAYAHWAGKRLPTEGGGEKAARGPEGYEYPRGNEVTSGRANTMLSRDELMNSNGVQPVGTCSGGESPCGADDMIGNVLEWTTTWFDAETERIRVLKGGAWSLGREDGRASARYGFFAPE